MPQSLSKILVHIIFSTKNRVCDLGQGIRAELWPYTATVLNNLECPALEVGGADDHVHILCVLRRTLSISELVEETKKPTSKWLKTKSPVLRDFHWQNGYGAFSVSQSDAERVVAYIAGQGERHQRLSFQDELRRFLEKYQVEYDERYVWD